MKSFFIIICVCLLFFGFCNSKFCCVHAKEPVQTEELDIMDVHAGMSKQERKEFAIKYAAQGVKLHKDGDFMGAVKIYTEALLVDPSISDIYLNRGTAFIKLDMLDLAIKDLDKAIKLDRKNSLAYYNRCILKILLYEDTAAAKADYDKAVELSPEDKYEWPLGN